MLVLLLSCADLTGFRFTGPAALELVGHCDRREDAVPLYRDDDGDGYGIAEQSTLGCLPADGWTDTTGDCDDTDPGVHADQPELCNGIDDDCDFAVDEAPEVLWCADRDEDGYGTIEDGVHACDQPSHYVSDCSDCDDFDVATHPGAEEVPGDGIDQDCDGVTD
jgi:hypothetical protein